MGHSSLQRLAWDDKTVLFAPAAAILPGRPWRRRGGGRMQRHLVWPDLLNARDLGGLPLGLGEQTAWRRVVRADNLNKLASSGVSALVAYGIRTVIDLRDGRELEKFPNPLAAAPPRGVVFLNVPLISEAEWEAIKDPARMAEGYVLTARLSHQHIAKAVAAVSDASPGGVVIHCHAGKERTGIVAALLLSLAGVPDETVAEDWTASDAYLQPLYEEWLANEKDPGVRTKRAEGFVTQAEHILDVLAYVRRTHGSLDDYLLAGGVTADQLGRVRRRLVSSGGRTPRNVA
jgi:protein tyrosine/serine phosphatase